MSYKLTICIIFTNLVIALSLKQFGTTGSVSDAFNVAASLLIAAWFGWLIRD
jgi:hypothetical protein